MPDDLREYLEFVRPWDDTDQKVVTSTFVSTKGPPRPDGQKPKVIYGFVTIDEVMAYIHSQQGRGEDVWFSTQKFSINPLAVYNTYTHGFHKANRKQETVTAIYNFHCDIDIKPDTYPDLQSAVNAAYTFCDEIGFPPPSMCVCSGRGLHCYWRLEEPLTSQQWLPIANALRVAMTQKGLKADHGITIDSARILRPAGTYNFKDPTNPLPTYILPGASKQHYPLDWITGPLKPFMGITPGPQLATVAGVPVGAFALGSKLNSNLTAGVGQSPPVDLRDIAKSCKVIEDEFTNHGAGSSEPLWSLMALVSAFDLTPGPTFEALSDGYAGYDPVATAAKLAIKDANKDKVGWPSCNAISAADGVTAAKCFACPHFAAGGSPLNLKSQPAPVPGSLPGDDPDLPVGAYWQGPAGQIMGWEYETKNGQRTGAKMPVCILDQCVRDGFFEPETKEVVFTWVMTSGECRSVRTGQYRNKDIGAELRKQGFITQESAAQRIGVFFLAWATHLLERGKTKLLDNMGWDDEGGFIHGEVRYTPKGPGRATLSKAANGMAAIYRVKGAPTDWQFLRDIILGSPNAGQQALFAAAFAAPLVKLCGLSSTLLSPYSADTGTGKTTALRTAMAVWGQPVQAANATNDTIGSMQKMMAATPHFPMIWDELSGDEDSSKRIGQLAFQLGQGRDKRRLHADTSMNQGGSFATLVVAASNRSLGEMVANVNINSDAGMARVFEIRMPPTVKTPGLSPSKIDTTVKRLEDNYGHAGVAYIEWVLANKVHCQNSVARVLEYLEGQLGTEEPHRFWRETVAGLLCGATFARAAGVAAFDLTMLKTFLLEEFAHLAELGRLQVRKMSVVDNIADLLHAVEGTGKTIFTDYINSGLHNPVAIKCYQPMDQIQRMPDLWAQRSDKDNKFLIKLAPFTDWLQKRGLSPRLIVDELVNRYGAKRVRATIGAGISPWPLARSQQARCLEIDMSQF